jgi:uncharacterized protein YjbI with pentapeptide repeats
MALIAVAADKGAPGVTTTATALAAVWPRPVVLAECDPAGGDIVYRLPGAHGGRLDPRRGLLSLAVAARHGLGPAQVWEHAQRLRGGLDVLAGVTNAEQGSGIEPLWGPVGDLLATLPQADVIADCGRLGPDGPYYELLAQAAIVILVIRPSLGEVLRLRDRVAAVAVAVGRRGGRRAQIGVLVLADRRRFRRALAEVGHAVGGANSPVGLVGGIAYEPKSAQRLRGEWGGRLDRSLLIRTARDVAAQLAGEWLPPGLPASNGSAGAGLAGARPAGAGRAVARRAVARPAGAQPAGAWPAGAWPAGAGPSGAQPAGARPAGGVPAGRRGLGATAGTQDTRAWAPGAREPAARTAGRPAAAVPAGQRAADWAATGPEVGPGARAWEQRARPGVARPGPPWPDPAWPDPAGAGSVGLGSVGLGSVGPGSVGPGPVQPAPARPGPAQPVGRRAAQPARGRAARPAGGPAARPVGGRADDLEPLPGPLAAADLTAAQLTAARLAASQLTAAELTAAQVAATRLAAAQASAAQPGLAQPSPTPTSPAQSGSAQSGSAQSGPAQSGSAQPGRPRRGALRPGAGRGTGRGMGRGAGRGRHAGGPAQPAASPDAAGPSASRARGW